jgi:hypothetical protein
MATTIFAETLDNFQHSVRIIPESRSFHPFQLHAYHVECERYAFVVTIMNLDLSDAREILNTTISDDRANYFARGRFTERLGE